MKLTSEQLSRFLSDVGLDRPFIKGQSVAIKNFWHFTTDGNDVDMMFCDDADFRAGMNRVFVVIHYYNAIILAFSLMDTHVHFILYGDFEECNRFMHEYLRLTGQYIARIHGDEHKLDNVHIHHQLIDTDMYLKTAICYTIKNAPVGGIPFMGQDYPWSSGPLYFRREGNWASPGWEARLDGASRICEMGVRERRALLRTRVDIVSDARVLDGIVFPGDYVAWEVVEKIFHSCKGFNYFMCASRESDVESRGGAISYLTIPMQELRQHKAEMCKTLYNTNSIRGLDTSQRLRLARALKSKYNCSSKQIARICGLLYNEVRQML